MKKGFVLKIILIFLLFITSNLFSLDIKIKNKQYNNIGNVKAMLDYSKDYSILEKVHDKNYVSRMIVKVDNELIFDLKLSKYISTKPIIKFKYKSLDANSLHVELIRANGDKQTYTKKIRKKDMDKAFKIKHGVELIAPDIASWGAMIPVTVRSSIKAKSVKLFVQVEDEYIDKEQMKNKNMLLACEWIQTPYSVIDYQVRIRMKYSGYIKVVIEAQNGKSYLATRFIQVSVSGGN